MMTKDDNPLWANLSFSLVLKTVSHPFDYAKVLIQLGHEPLPPYPTRTILNKPALGLPNVITYVKYIKKVDGFSGCYRGLSSRLLSNSVSIIAHKSVHDATNRYCHKLFPCPPSHIPEAELNETDKWLKLWRDTLIEVTDKSVSIIASHPFQVITLRIMGQFIGGEMKYNGLISSIREIYNNEGILGFFSGLIPRLLGEIMLIIFVNTCTFLTRNFIGDVEIVKFSSVPIAFIGSAFTYPFTVVSSCMAVNDCGIAAGNPPQMPIYRSWVECWHHLSRTEQLNRGSSMFFRYYKGPYASPIGYHNFIIKKD